MAEFAATQRDARSAWLSQYPFESLNGGLGVSLSCTTSSGTSSRTELVGTGSILMLTNVGDVTVYVALGDSTVVATTSYYPVLPQSKEVISINNDSTTTHIAALTASSTATLLAHRGYGN